ncbi:hypothetical protein [Dyadobacter sp. CY312]|uniref:hypothetical protein n=1 Tax=Dyadobacter sp. CY312 TaxID=2907303 RepID=UPI001F2F1F5F|nr:hypothetical protein [Dyadobacter sp. CY312]MCE7044434.1 hypothetical protein [Dyadobacter sp. CY312]
MKIRYNDTVTFAKTSAAFPMNVAAMVIPIPCPKPVPTKEGSGFGQLLFGATNHFNKLE